MTEISGNWIVMMFAKLKDTEAYNRSISWSIGKTSIKLFFKKPKKIIDGMGYFIWKSEIYFGINNKVIPEQFFFSLSKILAVLKDHLL